MSADELPSACGKRGLLVDALDPGHPAAAELKTHAAGCPECGPELEALGLGYGALAALPEPAPSPELLARVAAEVAREPVQATGGAWRSVAVAAAGAAAFAGAIAWKGLRPDLRYLSIAMRLGPTAILAGLYLAGMGAVFLWRRAWGIFLVAAAGAALGIGAMEPGFQLQNAWTHTGCIPAGIGVGLAPLVVAFALARGRVDRGAIAGAVIGTASGLLAMAVLHLHCNIGNPGHGLIGHAGVTLILAGIGAATGNFALVRKTARA
jgi:hypothetical protein